MHGHGSCGSRRQNSRSPIILRDSFLTALMWINGQEGPLSNSRGTSGDGNGPVPRRPKKNPGTRDVTGV